jgi:hypothetical protein
MAPGLPVGKGGCQIELSLTCVDPPPSPVSSSSIKTAVIFPFITIDVNGMTRQGIDAE